MADLTYLDWPFFSDEHRRQKVSLDQWCEDNAQTLDAHDDVDRNCQDLVAALGQAGWLGYCVPAEFGGHHAELDVRSLCLMREGLGYHSGLADFAFAMQGLGSGAISLFGDSDIKTRFLPRVADGSAIAAFALSEADAGSDVAAMSTTAEREGDEFVINGSKTWISNGGIADFYTVFARTGEQPGARGLSAFVVEADNPGLEIEARIDVIAPHPLATLRFDNCRIPASQQLGTGGQGFKIAMATLDVFRTTVAAAALGFGRRAHDEALKRATGRKLFGAPLANLQLTQASLADMALNNDTSALLIYRSAWLKDTTGGRVTREAAMAKLHATEAAQQTIDQALQLFGGQGVVSGEMVERLYREIRALRIYEGASEVQKVIIARQALDAFAAGEMK